MLKTAHEIAESVLAKLALEEVNPFGRKPQPKKYNPYKGRPSKTLPARPKNPGKGVPLMHPGQKDDVRTAAAVMPPRPPKKATGKSKGSIPVKGQPADQRPLLSSPGTTETPKQVAQMPRRKPVKRPNGFPPGGFGPPLIDPNRKMKPYKPGDLRMPRPDPKQASEGLLAKRAALSPSNNPVGAVRQQNIQSMEQGHATFGQNPTFAQGMQANQMSPGIPAPTPTPVPPGGPRPDPMNQTSGRGGSAFRRG